MYTIVLFILSFPSYGPTGRLQLRLLATLRVRHARRPMPRPRVAEVTLTIALHPNPIRIPNPPDALCLVLEWLRRP